MLLTTGGEAYMPQVYFSPPISMVSRMQVIHVHDESNAPLAYHADRIHISFVSCDMKIGRPICFAERSRSRSTFGRHFLCDTCVSNGYVALGSFSSTI